MRQPAARKRSSAAPSSFEPTPDRRASGRMSMVITCPTPRRLFRGGGCEKDWDPRHRVPLIEQEIRDCVGRRKVFFFVSGGVDSSVAFTLSTRALGADRVRGVYVDTGLMREGETEFVRRIAGLEVEGAQREFQIGRAH